MFEVLFYKLLTKYGEEFNWSAISCANKYFIQQAKKEIHEKHPLYGKILYSVAKCESNDDVLFAMSNEQYVIIHLTYSMNGDNNYPRFNIFKNIYEVLEYIEKSYIQDYL